MLDVDAEIDTDDDVNLEEARERGPSKDPEQLRVEILRVPALSLPAPSACHACNTPLVLRYWQRVVAVLGYCYMELRGAGTLRAGCKVSCRGGCSML